MDEKTGKDNNNVLILFNFCYSLLPVVGGVILAVLVLYSTFSGKKTNFEELALGKTTPPYYGEYKGKKIHCKGIDDAEFCLEGIRSRNHSRVLLWFGNSQLHAINQYVQGQENAPMILFRHLNKEGIDLVTFSQPNANLQEHYVLFEYLRRQLPLTALILPVVFDDLRETGLRSSIASALLDDEVVQSLKKTAIGVYILKEQKQNPDNNDFSGIAETIQERIEVAINNWLADNSELWALRAEARGSIFNYLYQTRNTIFGIKPRSKRGVMKAQYKINMSVFDAILKSAAEAEIKVVVYIVPIRNDIEIPYDSLQYLKFKKEVENISKLNGAVFANLESLVPPDLWGKKGTTFDFMHFQSAGHALLAEAIDKLLNSIIPEYQNNDL